MDDTEKTPPVFASASLNRRRGPRPQDVLVADDTADVRELWRACLTLSGYA